MGRVAIVVGHNKLRKGAYSKNLHSFEFDYYIKLTEELKKLDPTNEVDIYQREHRGGYLTEMREVCNKLNKKKYKLIIELHFNGAADEAVNGAEVLLFHSSKKGIKEAVRFLNELKEEYRVRIRGLRPITKITQRGAAGICGTKSPYILLEPFFGSNKEESEKFKDIVKFAKFLYKFIMEVE